MTNVMANLSQLNQDDNIIKLLNQLTPEDKEQLLGYLGNLYKRQDQMVLDFFQTKPKLLEALLSKKPPTNYNVMSQPQNGMGYYPTLGGIGM